MTENPLLNEIYQAREKLLNDAEGDVERLLEGIRKRESESGREFLQPKLNPVLNPLQDLHGLERSDSSGAQSTK